MLMSRFPKAILSELIPCGSNILNINRAMSSTSDAVVLVNEQENCGILTLNRPKFVNALNIDMIRGLYASLKKWESTKSLVIVKSALEKTFCAGGDVRALVEEPTIKGETFFREGYTLNHLIGTYKVPYVALINGVTIGNGACLAVHGRYRVATERTIFAMPETIFGIFPDGGGCHFLIKMAGELGMYLALTGVRLKGKDVQMAGIATHYCDSDKMPELEQALVACTSQSDIEKTLRKFCPVDSSEFIFAKAMPKINSCFSGGTVEDIIENLQNDNSEWAQNTLQTLSLMSPLSLKVTHHQLRAGQSLSLAECLQMEFRLSCRHLVNSDFAEGVRARLIEKDNQPKWKYAKIEDVPDQDVRSFFERLDDSKELKF